MAFLIHPAYADNTAYTVGTIVNENGVDYEALNAIAATNTLNPSEDDTNWKAVAVTKIQDYNSLVESIRLQLNVRSQPEINNSIPMFIQLVEESFKTRIRAPQQRRVRTFTVDSSSRIQPPADLMEIINIRVSADESTNQGTFSNDIIEILNANYEEYQRVLRANNANGTSYNSDVDAFDTAVYWFDNRYFHFAPEYDEGTIIEMVYYAAIPQLGDTVMVTDSAGNPLDSEGRTRQEWEDAGSPGGTFTQDEQTVTSNWFTAVAPQLLMYGALLKAAPFLNNDPRVPMWEEAYVFAEKEVHDFIATFEDSQPHVLYIQNAYSSQI